LSPQQLHSLAGDETDRLTLLPADVVDVAEYFSCPSIAYTYSEPIVWFEYMIDIATAARAKKIKNCWITCGYIQEEPLLELCKVTDAANVNLKSFDEQIYRELNTGKLEPILATLKTLKREGVWFEVTNLVVPTYTDKPEMIRRMCDWLLANLGPDYPLHFSRFHPAHKLTHLPSTPVDTLLEAQEIARSAGLKFVYVGNCPEVRDGETTICPQCKKAVIERNVFSVTGMHMTDGKCQSCGTRVPGVWTA
jgi:pyruvate formate lyase activating enzyme